MTKDRRTELRDACYINARCAFAVNDSINLKVTNLTANGCKLVLPRWRATDLGQVVVLKFDQIRGILAKIVWQLEQEIGLEFVDSLHPAMVQLLIYGPGFSAQAQPKQVSDQFGRPMPKLADTRRIFR